MEAKRQRRSSPMAFPAAISAASQAFSRPNPGLTHPNQRCDKTREAEPDRETRGPHCAPCAGKGRSRPQRGAPKRPPGRGASRDAFPRGARERSATDAPPQARRNRQSACADAKTPPLAEINRRAAEDEPAPDEPRPKADSTATQREERREDSPAARTTRGPAGTRSGPGCIPTRSPGTISDRCTAAGKAQ